MALNPNHFIMLMNSRPGIWTGRGREGLISVPRCWGTQMAGSDPNGCELESFGGSYTHMSGSWAGCLESWWNQLGLLTRAPIWSPSMWFGQLDMVPRLQERGLLKEVFRE